MLTHNFRIITGKAVKYMVTLKDENAKDKETVLNDDAAIYQRREEKTERQKFSEMKTFKEKLNYFRMYYLKTVLAVIAIIGLVISLIYTIITPGDEYLLRVAFVDYPFDISLTQEMETDFIEASGITLGEHEKIEFDGSTYQISTRDVSSASVLSTHIMAREIDIMIAPESLYTVYAFNGTLLSLTEELPTDLYAKLTDRFFFCKLKQENESIEDATGDDYVLGIYLDETPFWDKYKQYIFSDERPVVGIVLNGPNRDNAKAFLRYLFENMPEID